MTEKHQKKMKELNEVQNKNAYINFMLIAVLNEPNLASKLCESRFLNRYHTYLYIHMYLLKHYIHYLCSYIIYFIVLL